VRRLRPGDRDAILALDHAATNENRRPVLDMLPALLGLGLERDGELAGFALQTPWGAGPAVVAADDEAASPCSRRWCSSPSR
jgi:hypothetical protein